MTSIDEAAAEVASRREARSWRLHLLSLATGSALGVSVIYLPQALLADMAADLRVSTAQAGSIPTAVQLGYAVGIFLLVPLADRIAPRRQVTVQILLMVVALIATALMPGAMTVAVGFAAVGLVANIAQVIISASGKLAPPGEVGQTVATIVGSLTVGIFGGRIAAGLLVSVLGWRWVLVVFAGVLLAVLPVLRRALALAPPPVEVTPYGRLLLATLNSARRSRATGESVLMQFFVFAAFNALWSVMVLHLTGTGHGWSSRSAGLFGLLGLAAGLVAPVVYRRLGGMQPLSIAGVFLVVFLVATISIAFDADLIAAFAVSVFLFTAANQFIQTAAQRRVLIDNAEHPAPANALFMVGAFFGGAVGSATGVATFTSGGMTLVGWLGAALLICAGLVWASAAVRRRRGQVSV
jgi:predicted MFS family arabinose efflux permease